MSTLKNIGYGLLYCLVNNLFLLFLCAFFAYRTFFEGRLNWALLVLLIALFLIIVCRVIFQYRQSATTNIIYRGLVLLSVGLLCLALCIQTLRFVLVFVPTMTEFTLPKILVRVGVTTANFWVFALLFSFLYYLYTHEMTKVIWYGSVDRILQSAFAPRRHDEHYWRRVRFSSLVLMHTIFWGGLLSFTTLTIGLIAWLLR